MDITLGDIIGYFVSFLTGIISCSTYRYISKYSVKQSGNTVINGDITGRDKK
jgi:hypothetical protein